MAQPDPSKPKIVARRPSLANDARFRQDSVSRFYALRQHRVQLVPIGVDGTGSVATDDFEKVVLQKDHLNYVGDHGSQTPALREVEVTRDADGGMRFWADPEVELTVKNTSGVTITSGTPVYATGSVGATSVVEVAAADAGNSAKMPAIGLVAQTLAPNDVGTLMVVGVLRQQNTGSYSINQTLYVANGGGLTSTRPTATTQLVQNIGRVVRVNASSGEILVYGAGRTNDVPNYAQARLLGRGQVSGAGPAQELTIGTGLSLIGTDLSASQDLFRAIAVSGQNTIYAAANDTLEFVAGTNITLTTDDTLKTVTIDATGGGGGAPTTADYLVKTADAGLSAERVVTNSTTVTANWGTAGQVAFERAALTGDVTASANSNATTIANDAVTYAKIQNVSATDKVLGRQSAGSGDVEEIACTSAGRALIDDVDAAAQRTTLGLATIASSASASDLTAGTVATARLGTGTANSTTFLRGDQTWATPAGGGSNEVKFADAGMTATSVASTTLVDLASKTVTVTAGDTIEIEIIGTILNNSGATRTYTFEAELGAFAVTCVDGTTVAASATNRAPIKIRAVYSVASTTSAGVVVFAERAAPGAADTGLSIATTTYRHAWHTSASNLTGSQAIKLRCLSSAATATQTFHVHSFIVRQYAQAL